MKTTLQLNIETLNKLKTLKQFERQSYDEVLNILIGNYEEDEPLTDEEMKSIQRGLEDIRAGRTTPIEQVAKEFGVKLK